MVSPLPSAYADDYYEVLVDATAFVRLTRTDHPYEDIGEIISSLCLVEQALVSVHRPEAALLLDVRQAPIPRNRLEYERATTRLFKRLLESWKSSALLVKTATGKMHGVRVAREQGFAYLVFDRAEDAEDYICKSIFDK